MFLVKKMTGSSEMEHTERRGCQLPDFSLRSQIFCYTAVFSTTFLYMLKTRLFFTSQHKTTSKHHRIQECWLYFAKGFCDPPQTETGKHPHPAGSSCAWHAYHDKHFAKFPDFFLNTRLATLQRDTLLINAERLLLVYYWKLTSIPIIASV